VRRLNPAHTRIAAYAVVVLAGAYGFWSIEQESQDRCRNAELNRQSVLAVVAEIEHLGRDLTVGDEDGEVTPQQRAALLRFQQFEEHLIEALDRPVCDERGNPVS
jgi:hypothetical protein